MLNLPWLSSGSESSFLCLLCFFFFCVKWFMSWYWSGNYTHTHYHTLTDPHYMPMHIWALRSGRSHNWSVTGNTIMPLRLALSQSSSNKSRRLLFVALYTVSRWHETVGDVMCSIWCDILHWCSCQHLERNFNCFELVTCFKYLNYSVTLVWLKQLTTVKAR